MKILSKFAHKLQAGAVVSLVVAGAAYAADAPPAYTKAVMTQVSGKVEYPKMAKMRHQEGVVTLQLTIDGAGTAQAAVEKSSGIQSLDDAAVAAAAAAAPFPAPPEAGTVVHGNIRFAAD
jgi:TonB family protein